MPNFSTNQPINLSAAMCSQPTDQPKTPLEIDNDIDEKIAAEVRDCVVQFYRSARQAEGKYGRNDTYNGSFGFDRFSSIVAPGAIQHYKKIKNLKPLHLPIDEKKVRRESEGFNADTFSEYACPYVSIGINQTVTLQVKAEQSIKQVTGYAYVCFKSYSESVIFKGGKQEIKESLEIDHTCKPVEITVTKELSSEAFIYVYLLDNMGKECYRVGGLVVVPNKVRRIDIQPVIVRIKKDDGNFYSSNSLPPNFDTDLFTAFNNKSFNQAHIVCDKVLPHKQIEFKKSDFNNIKDLFTQETSPLCISFANSARNSFNKRINELFRGVLQDMAAGDTGSDNKDRIKRLQDIGKETGYDLAIDNLVKYFQKLNLYDDEEKKKWKEYTNIKKCVKKAAKFHYQRKVTSLTRFRTGWKKGYTHVKDKGIYDNYLKARKVFESKLNEPENRHLLPQDTPVHTFANMIDVYQGIMILYIHLDIEGCTEIPPTAKSITVKPEGGLQIDGKDIPYVPGYAYAKSGSTHIFNQCINKTMVIMHEIGHALGLRHPFDDNLMKPFKIYKDSNIRKINLTDREIILYTLVDLYKTLFENSENPHSYYYTNENHEIERFLSSVQNIISVEVNEIKYEKEELENVAEKKYRIWNGISEQEVDQKYNTHHNQSKSYENIMDYDHGKNGETERDFLYTMFYYWQWEMMWKYTKFK